MKTTAELFGENLRYKLIEQRKTQADIARYLKVTEASVSRWVNGQAMPRAKMIDKICLFLHCSVEDLTTDHSKPVEYAPEDIIASLTRAEVSKSEVFIKNWKEVYQMLDSAHKRAFWHRLIYRIEMNGKEVKKLYFL